MAQIEKVESVEYVLRIDEEELEALVSILARVGGPPETRRGISNRIWNAIQDLDVIGKDNMGFPVYDYGDIDGHVYFTDKE